VLACRCTPTAWSSTLRIELPFPATVRGVDRRGERFELKTLLDNYLRFTTDELIIVAFFLLTGDSILVKQFNLNTAPSKYSPLPKESEKCVRDFGIGDRGASRRPTLE
jgi:hypothetical protein